jgi:hypothetical protein
MNALKSARVLGEAIKAAQQDVIRVDGLEITSGLMWAGGSWRPGGEYIQKICVKNATTRMIHVEYVVPRSKQFFMAFPVPLSLSPGISVYIDVRFRPIRFEELYDKVSFSVDGGSTIDVSISARLAELHVQVSKEAAFGYAPVNEPTSQTIIITNVGTVDASFSWEVPVPFLLTPKYGRVNVGESATISVTVVPIDASVLHSEAICDIQGGEQQHSVKLTAQGKFQHVIVEPTNIDLGDVLVRSGKDITERTITVRNVGFVRSTVDIENVDYDRRQFFSVKPRSQILNPEETATFVVKYLADSAGTYTCEHLRVTTPGGTATIVKCSARTIGPKVSISRKDRRTSGVDSQKRRPLSIQFGDVKVGDDHSNVITLTNHSRAPALFDLECEDSGVFFFNETKGTIPALLYKSLVVVFKPPFAGNFYRRVPCMLLDSSPVYVDLIGTAYDEKQRPNPLRQRHVDAFRLRPFPVRLLSPDRVLELTDRGMHISEESRALEAEWHLSSMPSRSGDRPRAANALYKEYFRSNEDPGVSVCLLSDVIEFGAATRAMPPLPHEVFIQNRTGAKMTAHWVVPPSNTSTGKSTGDRDFKVVPETCDIEAGTSAAFQIFFRPSQDSFYYFQELEAYVAPKVNRSFRLVDEKSFTPPQCLTLKVTGHTFRDAQSFQPKVQTSFGGGAAEQTLHFPPCMIGDSVYTNFQMFNSSEVPAAFDFAEDPRGIFKFEPSTGMLPVHSYQIVTVRFTPRFERTYNVTLPLILNHTPDTGTIALTLIASAGIPRLLLPDKGIFCIKPTCLGVTSSRSCTLRNVSRLPLRFEWRIPQKYKNVIQATPSVGDIEGNNSIDVTITFAPQATGKIKVHIPIDVFCVTGSDINSLVLLDAIEAERSISTLESYLHARRLTNQNVDVIDRSVDGINEEKKNEGGDEPVDDIPLPSKFRVGDAKSAERKVEFGTPIQNLTLTLITEGTTGALTFLSPTLDFGACLVHETSSYPIYIENNSDCTLLFKLDAVVQFRLSTSDLDRDENALIEMEASDPEFEAARWTAANRHHRIEHDKQQEQQQLQNSSPGHIGESLQTTSHVSSRVSDVRDVGIRASRKSGERMLPGMPGANAIEGEASLNDPVGVRKGLHGLYTRTIALHTEDPHLYFKSRVTGDRGETVPIIKFSPASGVIPAHSKVRADVSFSPATAGTFNFRIYYETRTEEDASGKSSSISLPGSAMSKAAAFRAAADAESDPRDPSTIDWGTEPVNSNKFFCDAIGMGSYPTVCIEDARQLTSRESYLTLYPRHFSGLHNRHNTDIVEHDVTAIQTYLLSQQAATIEGLSQSSSSRNSPIKGSGVAGKEVSPTLESFASTSASTAMVPAPLHAFRLPAPRDAWVRSDAFQDDSVAWGSCFPQDKGWGGWKFQLPTESFGPREDYIPPHYASALDLMWNTNASTIPGSRGASHRLWTQFTIRDLNRFLATRLTSLEDKYNRATQMTRDPTTLASFPFEFSPAPLGSPPMVVLLHFSNNGKLATSLDFQFPNERDMDVEPWAEVDEPTRDELNDNELLERRIFDVQPRSLKLLPGQSATVRMHYAYSTMISGGRQEVIIMLRIKNGKPVRLLLRGCTLALDAAYLYCGIPSRVLRFAAVPLGVIEPPVQTVLIVNPSAVAVRYEVQPGTIKAVAHANYGVDIFTVLNPTGVLPPGGECLLRIVFKPVEERMYRLRLDIAYIAIVDDGSADELRMAAARDRISRTGLQAAVKEDGDDEAAVSDVKRHGLRLDEDTGVGIASGSTGYEADLEGVLQIRISAQGFLPHRELRLTLIPRCPSASLVLIPPVVPKSNRPRTLDFEAASISARRGAVSRPKEGALKIAKFGQSCANDFIADGIYCISGVDSVSASVSTFYNPYEILLRFGQAKEIDQIQLFSGPDAVGSASALTRLQRSENLLARLAKNEHSSTFLAENSIDFLREIDSNASEAALGENADSYVIQGDDTSEFPKTTMLKGSAADVVVAHQASKANHAALPPEKTGPTEAATALYRLVARLGSELSQRSLYRPGASPPLFFSASPPFRRWVTIPHQDLPEGAATFSNEVAAFGDVPTGGVLHKIVVIRNRRSDSYDYRGRLFSSSGPILFVWDSMHPLIISGELKIFPMSGSIDVGGAQVVRVSFESRTPQVVVADVACIITVSSTEQRKRSAEITRMSSMDMIKHRDELRAILSRNVSSRSLSRSSTSPSRFKDPSTTSAHRISITEKTTASRTHSIEQHAKDAALRISLKAASAKKAKFFDKATRHALDGAGASALLESVDISQTIEDKLGIATSRNTLVQSGSGGFTSVKEIDQAEDGTSIAVTIGGDLEQYVAEGSRVNPPDPRAQHVQQLQNPIAYGKMVTQLIRATAKDKNVEHLEELAASGTLPAKFNSGASQHPSAHREDNLGRSYIASDADDLRRSRIASRARNRVATPRALDDAHKGSLESMRSVEEDESHNDVPASELPLAQPPHAPLFLHITARVCGVDEFVLSYSPHHLSAFYHPHSSSRQLAALSSRPGSSVHAHTETLDGPLHRIAKDSGTPAITDAVRNVLTSLLSDVVNDVTLTDALGSIAVPNSGDFFAGQDMQGQDNGENIRSAGLVASPNDPSETAEAEVMRRKTEARALYGGVTFNEIVETRGDVAALSTRVASRMAMQNQSYSTRVSTSIFDNSLPADQLQKLQTNQSELQLLVDADCRDVCARMLEDSLFTVISEAVSGIFDILTGTSSLENATVKEAFSVARQTTQTSLASFSEVTGLEEGEVVRQEHAPEYKRGDESLEM